MTEPAVLEELNLQLHPHIQGALRELTPDEFNLLRDNILSDGTIHEPLIVWEGWLIDGHHRLKIYAEHKDRLPRPDIKEHHFAGIEQAGRWLEKRQAGRRNLTKLEADYVRGLRLKRHHELPQKGQTVEKIAEEEGVSLRKLQLDSKQAKAVDKLTKANRDAWFRNELPISTDRLSEFAGLSPATQTAMVRAVSAGEYENLDDCMDDWGHKELKPKDHDKYMKDWNRKIESFCRHLVRQMAGAPKGPWLDKAQLGAAMDHIRAACATLRAVKLHEGCPVCMGHGTEGCSGCKRTGFVPKRVWEIMRNQ